MFAVVELIRRIYVQEFRFEHTHTQCTFEVTYPTHT